MSAKKMLLEQFLNYPNIILSREKLSLVAGVHDWQRNIRTLRSEGWQIESTKEGYILNSTEQIQNANKRISIDAKLRYLILQRDNSTCQRCGKTIDDGIKLEVDHKIPVNWGGTNDIDNLWTLCNNCNGGKKHFFNDYDEAKMKAVMNLSSASSRIKTFFELNPNVEIPPYKLDVISQVRDWTRITRMIRVRYKMDIQWLRATEKYPKGAYIFYP